MSLSKMKQKKKVQYELQNKNNPLHNTTNLNLETVREQ